MSDKQAWYDKSNGSVEQRILIIEKYDDHIWYRESDIVDLLEAYDAEFELNMKQQKALWEAQEEIIRLNTISRI